MTDSARRETTQRFYGPGLPAGYAQHVPAIADTVRYYLDKAETVDFCPLSSASGEGCDLHGDPR